MLRESLSVVLVFLVALFAIDPQASAQFTPAPSAQSGYPADTPEAGAGYGQAGQYPPASPNGTYPSSNGYPSANGYPAPSGYPAQGADPGAGAGNQPPDTQDVAADQQHGVARISIVQGDVNLKRGDNGMLAAAVINAPLVSQDHLQTSQGSRAEVELDYANLIRLAPDTDLAFAALEYHRSQLQLGAGTIVYRVLRNSDAQAEIDTPSVALRGTGESDIRISVLPDGTTQIGVRAGAAEIFGPRGSERIEAGHAVLVRGNPADPEFQETYLSQRDQFDDWSVNRDHELISSQSYRYVSPDVSGADDLDHYGAWVSSEYGQVWQPQSAGPDWSPYSDGQWSYQPYYGWTWVDAAPWGWAPYHYGRWFRNGGRGWCWWPGALHSSYVWSPALVGFFGWGGFGVGIGLGGLGWVALAPFEVFHPWWGRGGWYGDRFHAYGGYGRNLDVSRLYRNAAFRGGAMTAGYNSFAGPNHRFSVASRAQLTTASLFRGQMPLTPTRAAYQFSNRTAVANPRLASAGNRTFFARGPVGSARAGSGGSYSGQSLGSAGRPAVSGGWQSHGVAPNLQGGSRAPANAAGGSGWQRFGAPGTTTAPRQSFSGSSEASGWHRFGQPERGYSAPQGRPSMPAYAAPGANSFSRGNSFQAAPHNNSPNQFYATPGRSYASPAPRYNPPPAQHYTEPSRSYSAPRYSAPNTSHASTPHYSAPSAPSHSGGGGSGGGSHSGGGGGHHR